MRHQKAQFNRFKDAPWFPNRQIPIMVGGAGGIGSWTALLLSRAGFHPVVYDFDMLEEINLAGQIFPKKYIGLTKVAALQAVIRDFSDDEITCFPEKIDTSTPGSIFSISAFDNMQARKDMFKKWKENALHSPNPLWRDAIFIDGRLEAEQMWIYCVTNDIQRITEYEENHLQDDSQFEEAPCTLKQTSHAAAMIGAHITGFFTNHFTNIRERDEARTVPFCWSYFIPMDLVEVQNLEYETT